MKQHPFFLLLFTIYPGLALLTWNLREVETTNIILRPLLFSIVIALVFWVLLFSIVRNAPKAILLSTVFIIFFFSFGHISISFEESSLFENLGNASRWMNFLVPILMLLLVFLLCYAILRTKKDLRQTYSPL